MTIGVRTSFHRALALIACAVSSGPSHAAQLNTADAGPVAIAGLAELAGSSHTNLSPRVASLANTLINSATRDRSGLPIGWSYGSRAGPHCSLSRSFDAFGDGSCNDPDTVYAFQTALAATFLGRAHDSDRRSELCALCLGRIAQMVRIADECAGLRRLRLVPLQ